MVSSVKPLPFVYNWDRDFGSAMWNLYFPAQLSNTKALEEPAAIPKPDVVSTFIDCFTSAKTRVKTIPAIMTAFLQLCLF